MNRARTNRGPLRAITTVAIASLALSGRPVVAAATPIGEGRGTLRIDRLDKPLALDGVPGPEWPRELGKLGNVDGPGLKAPSAIPDLSARAAIAYDDTSLFVAVDVTDDELIGGGEGDHVDLVIASRDGSKYGAAITIRLDPGAVGKSAGKASIGGKPLAGAKVIEAPRKGGWTLEAQIPWSAIGARRVGLRGGVFVHDVDGGAKDGTVGSSPKLTTDGLGELLTTPEQGFVDGLAKQQRLGEPRADFVVNVVGDALAERVIAFDRYLVVIGPNYRGGKEYYFRDLAGPNGAITVRSLLTPDFEGDGRSEVVLWMRSAKAGATTSREVLQVMRFDAEVPELVFTKEIGIVSPKGSIENEVAFVKAKDRLQIRFRPGVARGLDGSSYDEPTETAYPPLLLPWGPIESQHFQPKGRTFEKVDEKSKPLQSSTEKPVATKAAPPEAMPPPAPTKAADAPSATKVYELYRRDRRPSSTARFDQSGNVVGDRQAERVLLHDRDLVVFGPGYRGGSAYAYTQLPFAKGDDVDAVQLKDVTGDGLAELLVRGRLRALGSKGEEVERTVELVYQVTDQGIRRVFGAELRRAIGGNSVAGAITYGPTAGTIRLTPGKATGFTSSSYPFDQDAGPVGGIEPLLLPWGSSKSLDYAWNGSAFVRR